MPTSHSRPKTARATKKALPVSKSGRCWVSVLVVTAPPLAGPRGRREVRGSWRVEPGDAAVGGALLNDEARRAAGVDVHNHPRPRVEGWRQPSLMVDEMALRQLVADHIAPANRPIRDAGAAGPGEVEEEK